MHAMLTILGNSSCDSNWQNVLQNPNINSDSRSRFCLYIWLYHTVYRQVKV